MTYAAWLIAAVLALGVGAIAGHEAEAEQQDTEARASRDWVSRQVCNGRPFTWEDDKTIVCHKELP